MNININDPRLTAYALGEMSGSEKIEFEKILNTQPEALRAVEEIREASQMISATFAATGKEVTLSPMDRKRIESPVVAKPHRRKMWLYAGPALAAAALATVILTNPELVKMAPQVTPSQTVISQNETPPATPDTRDNKAATIAANPKVPLVDMLAPQAQQPTTPEPQVPQQEQTLIPLNKKQTLAGGSASNTASNISDVSGLAPAKPAAAPATGYMGAVGALAPTSSLSRVRQAGPAYKGYGGRASGQVVAKDKSLRESEKKRKALLRAEEGLMGDDEVAKSESPMDQDFNTEAYNPIVDNPFLTVKENPLSTFSIDVDTASYSNMRRFLTSGQLPPKDSVRIEEMINYFKYDYPKPASQHPFSVHLESTTAPWAPEHRLVRIAIKGREVEAKKRPASNLVFLIDVSGSMADENKLPLLRSAFKSMVENLNDNDRVAIVVYAGASGLVLPSTATTKRSEILGALDRLQAGGSTNGGEGIQLAYKIAQENFIKDGTNRVLLATDGDFNVGVTNNGDLVRLVQEKAKSGVFLTVLGFGMGNYKDATLEQIADKGNGHYAYIDNAQEGRRVLVEQMGETLVTIAKDVKLQLEFNPAHVAGYRLLGYENRILAKEDFNDDTKDAGEIGAGHNVTALYEVIPAGKSVPGVSVDALKYQKPQGTTESASTDELLTVKLRYKKPDQDKSQLLEVPLKDEKREFSSASSDMQFASAVAAFGMILRDSPHRGSAQISFVRDTVESHMKLKGQIDPARRELLDLVRKAEPLLLKKK